MRLDDMLLEILERGDGWVIDDGATTWDAANLLDDLIVEDGGEEALAQEVVWVPTDDAGGGSIVTLGEDGYQGRTLYRVRRLP